MTQDKKMQLIESLLRIFNSAKAEAEKQLLIPPTIVEDDDDISTEAQEALRRYRDSLPVSPAKQPDNPVTQACVFLLSTGHVVGAATSNPISHDKLDADDVIGMAHHMLQFTPGLKGKFEIVAIAMTTPTDTKSGKPETVDLDLYEQSLSELPDLKAKDIILVDPTTKLTAHSAPFSDYRIL